MSVRMFRAQVAGVSSVVCVVRGWVCGVVSVISVAVIIGIGLLAGFSSVAAAETCPNAEFRVGPSAGLPDCRAYEQVSPVDKAGGAFFAKKVGQSPDGTPAAVFSGFAAVDGLQDLNGAVEGAVYATTRTSSGWQTAPLPPPAGEYQTSNIAGGLETYLAGSLDGRSALWQGRRLGQPENRADFYVTRPGGLVEDVGILTPPGTPYSEVGTTTNIEGLRIVPVGQSSDLSHIVYEEQPDKEAGYSFWQFDSTSGSVDLYEFVGAGNAEPMLVGVDDSGKLISECGTLLAGTEEKKERAHNAVSVDGDTIFFTAERGCGSPAVNELFARIDNGQADAHTVAVSEPSVADCRGCDTSAGVLKDAHFLGGSDDGSKAVFTTTQPLLGGDSTNNVYEYDFDAPAGERLIRVSAGDSTVSGPAAEVAGVVCVSSDGSHVYFVAPSVLTVMPNGRGQVARSGANNLYVFERDAQYPAGRTVFVADLSHGDKQLWASEGEAHGGMPPANVTPDGRFLVFASKTEHLTADDTSTAAQIFEYDAQTGSLVRVSIGQNGYNDNGNTNIADASIVAPKYEFSEPTKYWSQLSVSVDGSYVFFQSTDGLTPQALNHKLIAQKCEVLSKPKEEEELCKPPLFEELEQVLEEIGDLKNIYANNIYEYHDGNVYLISDGRDITEVDGEEALVQLVSVGESGADVLFETADSLVAQDTDTNRDTYDARIDGGFPAPVQAPECSGEGCQGPLGEAPTLLSPGSEFQAGASPAPATSTPVAKAKAAPKPKRKAKKKTKSKKGGKAKRAAGRGRTRVRGGRS